MEVTNVDFFTMKPSKGLLGFASVILDGQLYLGSIAVFVRPDTGDIRLSFPQKQLFNKKVNYFLPLAPELNGKILEAVRTKLNELQEKSEQKNNEVYE